MSEQLKPCPFCGGEPSFEKWTEYDRAYPEPNEYECIEIKCSCGVRKNSVEEWNRRAGESDELSIKASA